MDYDINRRICPVIAWHDDIQSVQKFDSFVYMIIESMQLSLSNSSNMRGQASFCFQCTCGKEFHLIQNNNQRLRGVHQDMNTIIAPNIQAVRQSSPSKNTEKAQQQSQKLNSGLKSNEDQASNSILTPNHRMRSKKQRKRSIQTLLKGRIVKKDYEFRQDIAFFEGFKLIKNRQCRYEPYYCGNCKGTFFQINDYITHCIDHCRTLIHTDSSHTITLKQNQEETSEDLSDIEQQDPNFNDSDNPQQRRANTSNTNTPLCKQQLPQSETNQAQGFYHIFSIMYKLQDHRSLPFSCGSCSTLTFDTPNQYKRHLLKHHSKQLSISSSHAVLQIHTKKQKNNLYMCQQTQWHHNQLIYVCPCSTNNKMNMKGLIRHIISDHSGISPIYHQETRNKTFHQIIRNQQVIIPDAMRNLQRRGVDHKDVPFLCYPCKLQINNALQYKIHVRDLHQNKIHPFSSHIVIRFKRQRINHRRLLLISSHFKQTTKQRSVYYCSCQPGNKITMEALVQHIIQKHQGVSPEYCFNERIVSNGFPKKQRSQSTKQFDETKQEE